MEASLIHHLREVSNLIAEWAVVLIALVSVVVILAGSIEALVKALAACLRGQGETVLRRIWIRYARWLVAGLTFMLAGDLIETTMAPTREDVLRLAAIAVIRTFLNYFLDRDIETMRARAAEREEP